MCQILGPLNKLPTFLEDGGLLEVGECGDCGAAVLAIVLLVLAERGVHDRLYPESRSLQSELRISEERGHLVMMSALS